MKYHVEIEGQFPTLQTLSFKPSCTESTSARRPVCFCVSSSWCRILPDSLRPELTLFIVFTADSRPPRLVLREGVLVITITVIIVKLVEVKGLFILLRLLTILPPVTDLAITLFDILLLRFDTSNIGDASSVFANTHTNSLRLCPFNPILDVVVLFKLGWPAIVLDTLINLSVIIGLVRL